MRRLRRRSQADRDQDGAAALAKDPRVTHARAAALTSCCCARRITTRGLTRWRLDSVDGQGMLGRIVIAFPEVKRNLGKRTLLPLFGFREPEGFTLGIM